MHLPVVGLPFSRRQDDLARYRALLHHGRDEKVVAHHELVEDSGISHAREAVLEVAHHRLAGLRGLLGERDETRRKVLAELDDFLEDGLVLRREHAPRRRGYLHHRAERMHLRGADEQFRVERSPRQEGRPRAAADHVGADERASDESGGQHIRY